MQTWVIAALIIALPGVLSAVENRTTRASSPGRSVRAVSATRKAAPARAAPARSTVQNAPGRKTSAPAAAKARALVNPGRAAGSEASPEGATKGFGWSERFKRALWGGTPRRDEEPQPTPTPAPEPEQPPIKFGAQINQPGLPTRISQPSAPERSQEQERDNSPMLAPEESKLQTLNPFPGIHNGPQEKTIPPNPGSGTGTASGRNAITPNAPDGSSTVPDSGSSSGGHNRDQGGKPDDPSGNGNGNNP